VNVLEHPLSTLTGTCGQHHRPPAGSGEDSPPLPSPPASIH